MLDQIQMLKAHICKTSFLRGLSVVGVIYILLFIYAAFNNNAQRIKLESQLASQTITIQNGEIQSAPVSALTQEDQLESPPAKPEYTELSQTDIDLALLDVDQDSSRKSLIAAPVAGLYEESKFGKLPVVSPEGKTSFTVYKKPFLLNRDKPFLAIAVLDFGLSEVLSNAILKEIPSTVSIILNPYSQTPEEWQKKARSAGHEVWLQLMFEDKNFPLNDPGALGLMSSVSMKYNMDRLHTVLGRATGYAGIAAFTDQTLEKAEPMFTSVAKEIFSRGLGIFELNPEAYSFIEPLAIEASIPATRNFKILDDMNETTLQNLKAHIKSTGGSIVVLRPTPKNIMELREGINTLENAGVNIVPVSALAAITVSDDASREQ